MNSSIRGNPAEPLFHRAILRRWKLFTRDTILVSGTMTLFTAPTAIVSNPSNPAALKAAKERAKYFKSFG